MKIIIYILLIAIAANVSVVSADDKLNVLACEPEWAALVKELGGDLVAVKSATAANQDPHHIQARPSLIAAARRAELIVCTGAELEVGWLPLLQRKSANRNIQSGNPGAFMASDFVLLKGIPDKLDRSEGDIHAEGNPHFHLNPKFVSQVAKFLNERLQLLDNANAQTYQHLYKKFDRRWQDAILSWEKKAKPLTGKSMVVHHNSWLYLSEWLGLHTVATLEPKSGIPPTVNHLQLVLKMTKKKSADFIVHSSYQSNRSANWLSKRTGLNVIALPNTVGSSPEVNDLFDLFDEIIDKLLKVQIDGKS